MNRAPRIPSQRENLVTLVWIDTDEALIVRWDGAAKIDRVVSEVPARHRATGHVRHDPEVRHGGGQPSEDRVERDRQDRLNRFIERVAEQVPSGDAVRIVGPGVVRRRLDRRLRAEDRRLKRTRAVEARASAPLTEQQLVADVRELAGVPAPRRPSRETLR